MLQKSLRISHTTGTENPADALLPIAELLDEMAEVEGWPASLTMRANLILEEVVLNTLTHGNEGGLTSVDIDLRSLDNVLEVEITDNGKAFNPLVDAPTPDVNLPLQERPIGGLGLFLVQKMGQHLEYQRKGDCNQLKFAVHPES
ncbi:MAG: ATP-binding protein [bacterium]|nr:ATP-binding protein [bacterium]